MLQQLQHVSDQAVTAASDDLKSINWDVSHYHARESYRTWLLMGSSDVCLL